jgi:DNA-binding response OmpR family regulator
MNTGKKVLIVEDEKALARLLELTLSHEGYVTAVEYDGESALRRAAYFVPDLILLDMMLPGIDGMGVCRSIRRSSRVPIVILTAVDGTADKIKGLDVGANDYITKPFDMDELLARIRAALRSAAPAGDNASEISAYGVTMNLHSNSVSRSGRRIPLTKREFDLLEYLMKNRDIVLTRPQMLDNVWGQDYEGEGNIVDVYVRYLRAKLDDDFEIKLIHTVRGFGYVFGDRRSEA